MNPDETSRREFDSDITDAGVLHAVLDHLIHANSSSCERCNAALSMVVTRGSGVGHVIVAHEDDCDAA